MHALLHLQAGTSGHSSSLNTIFILLNTAQGKSRIPELRTKFSSEFGITAEKSAKPLS